MRSFADKGCRKKIGPRVEEERKSVISLPWSDLRVLMLLYSWYGNHVKFHVEVNLLSLCLVIAANMEPTETSIYEVNILLNWSYDIFYSLYLILRHAFIHLSCREIRSYRGMSCMTTKYYELRLPSVTCEDKQSNFCEEYQNPVAGRMIKSSLTDRVAFSLPLPSPLVLSLSSF